MKKHYFIQSINLNQSKQFIFEYTTYHKMG